MATPAHPRRRRVLLALVAVALVIVGATGGYLVGDRSPTSAPRSPPATTSASTPRPPTLAVGLVSTDAGVLTPPGAPEIPGFDAARALVEKIAPRFVRIDLRWDLLQPDADRPLDPDRVVGDGCGRESAPPCSGPASLRRTLTALKAAQVRHPGSYRPLISFWGMPTWAGAAPAAGCDVDAVRAGARPLAPEQEPAYRAAIAGVRAALTAAGIGGADWTPWNEPNAPYFLGPQRAACRADADPISVGAYGRLVAAMDEELQSLHRAGSARGDRLVVGELATWEAGSARVVPADAFLRALPDAVLCRADVVSLHGYLEARSRRSRGEPVGAALRELDRRPCLNDRPAWITETGVGAPHSNARRSVRPAVLTEECGLLQRQLQRWWRDPRITAAFQYSVRDDPAFPTGLLNEALTRTYPAAAVWQAWGGSRDPAAVPPALPAGCAAVEPPGRSAAPPG